MDVKTHGLAGQSMIRETNLRLIARLDIKGENLIKGVHLEGLRVIGDPSTYAKRYYSDGADELIYMDVVASLYGRNHLSDIIRRASKQIFIPMTVGGGIRGVDDVINVLRCGADKVAVNTAAVQNPEIVSQIAERFGSQCMVLSIEAKEQRTGMWEVYTDNGRERTGKDVISWAKQCVELGAGEILLTSVDKEGTRQGFDNELIRSVASVVPIPVIAAGGMGRPEHLTDVVDSGLADAVAMADILHYDRASIPTIRSHAINSGIKVRRYG